MDFTGRLLVERAATPSRTSIKEQEYFIHCYVRQDNLTGVCITDGEYEARVAFTMLSKVMEDFTNTIHPSQWVCVFKKMLFVFIYLFCRMLFKMQHLVVIRNYLNFLQNGKILVKLILLLVFKMKLKKQKSFYIIPFHLFLKEVKNLMILSKPVKIYQNKVKCSTRKLVK